MKEVKESTASKKSSPKEISIGKIILIVVFIIVGLWILCSVGSYFFARNSLDNFLHDFGFSTEEIKQSKITEDSNSISDFTTEEEYPTIKNEILDEDLISDQFPDNIPLPGGKVTSSSYTSEYSVDVNLATSSSIDDVYKWFEEALEGTDWVITSKSRDDNYASISFDNGKQGYQDDEYRRGSISVSDWGEYWNYREISITEYYY